MPRSYPDFKNEIKKYINEKYSSNIKILDVGPGCGTYAQLLPNYKNIDCVEIFEPYIREFNLNNQYKNVFNNNILDFDFEYYDIIIMGDILEHLSVDDSIKLLNKILPKCDEIIISVPYLYEQDEVYNNIYEIHLQSDLTFEIMQKRYPMLEMVWTNNRIGVFMKKKIFNLIWQTYNGSETTDHYEYVTNVLFKDIQFINHFDDKGYKTILDNSIIIYSCMGSEISNDMRMYLKKFKDLNIKYILLHLSNENLNHNHDYYSDAEHVFRPYYDSNIKNSNVTTLPLGFVSGYMNKTNEKNLLNKRDILVTFIGQVKSDRQDLINNLNDVDNKFLHLTKQWDCPTALSPTEVIEIYKRTIFIPCPKGWINPDSLRIFEALEWGCIPIIKKYNGIDYFKYIFGEHPIPVLNEWSEIKDLMDSLKNDDLLLLKINQWYKNYMNTVSENISRIVNDKLLGINKKLTVLIPFRDREENLKVFIPYFHNFMKNYFSEIPYEIVLIEQYNNKSFNKGILFNAGFMLTSGSTDYYALHDIDQLPVSADYSYHNEPCHLCVNAIEQSNDGKFNNPYYQDRYQQKGGAITVSKEIYELANGHSNNYWGWGLIDDDFSYRLYDAGHHLLRYGVRMNHGHIENNDKGYYITLNAKTDRFNSDENYKRNYNYALGVVNKTIDWRLEGLNTTKFNIINVETNKDYTKYIIDFENDK